MKKNESISAVMTKEPVSVHPGQKPSEVRALLAEGRFHHVPVVSGERLVGIISSTDMLRLGMSTFIGDGRAFDAWLDHEYSIEQIMQKEIQTLSNKDTVRDATRMLVNNAFHSVPIVDDSSNLVGIVTSNDLLAYLLEQY